MHGELLDGASDARKLDPVWQEHADANENFSRTLTLTLPYIVSAINEKLLYIFGACNAISIPIVWALYPESNQRTLEEMVCYTNACNGSNASANPSRRTGHAFRSGYAMDMGC
jgi:hypothetical protein